MALTPEEREALFNVVANEESVEGRAEAVLKLRAELEEETVGRNQIFSDYQAMESSYNQSVETIRNLQNTLPEMTKSAFAQEKQTKEEKVEPEVFGFDKLRG